MTEHDRGEAAELAREVAVKRSSMPHKRWRAPDALRERLLAYALRRREHGETISEIAGQVGMVESTLYRWLRRAEAESTRGLSQVAIVPAGGERTVEQFEVRPLPVRLITPRGVVVEGLDVESLVALLKALG